MKNLLLLLVPGFLLVSSARGGTISISPSLSWSGETAVIEIINRGNESARQVQAELHFAGKEKIGTYLAELPPGQPAYEEYSLGELIPERPGVYPARVLVKYADANGYAFSALLLQPIVIKDGRSSALHLEAKAAELSDRGELVCRVANLGGTSVRAECRLELSPEFRVTDPLRRLDLAPGAEDKLFFSVRNYAATPGSTYPVYLVAEYDEGSLHFTSLGMTTVTVVAGGARSRIWFIGAGVVVLLGAGLVIWLSFRRRPDKSGRG